ncbi:MAG: type I-C CRISPR-associated protein Cas5 [Nitrospirae bacterium]|nr:type I-C CRISPR-associated protein Cas5 [Nitrospirota bacterium]
MNGQSHTIEVWGDFACFTRPEMKVERFSYPIITPSAARGIFDAIYWDGIREREKGFIRPYFHWQIERIEILELPRYIALRRNEVKDNVPSERTIKSWMEGHEQPEPIWADCGKDELGTDQKGRTQRQTMALKKVRYLITARIVPKKAFSHELKSFDSQFIRRVKQGKCFQQPFFGCSEFPAFFEYVETTENKLANQVQFNQHIGWMLYDVSDLRKEVVSDDNKPFISLFDASVVNNVLNVPPFESDKVRKPERGMI